METHKIKQFSKITEEDKKLFGKKAYNISFIKNYATIPNGFVLSKEIMNEFLEDNNLSETIKRYLANLMIDNENIIPVVNAIQKLIIKSPFSDNLKQQILEMYDTLSYSTNNSAGDLLETDTETLVCVRHGEWSESRSNIYQMNIIGEKNLLESIKIAFASNFISKKIISKKERGLDLFEDSINPVIIQKMEPVQRSGIAISFNPETGNDKEIIINAVFGLGIAKDDPKLEHDKYIVNLDYEIIDSKIGNQEYAYEKDIDHDKTVKYTLKGNSSKEKLLTPHIKEIGKTIRKLSRIMESPLLIEWGFVKKNLVIFDVKELEIENSELNDYSAIEEETNDETDETENVDLEVVEITEDYPSIDFEDEIDSQEDEIEIDIISDDEPDNESKIIFSTNDITIIKSEDDKLEEYEQDSSKSVSQEDYTNDEEINIEDLDDILTLDDLEIGSQKDIKAPEVDDFDTENIDQPEIKDLYEINRENETEESDSQKENDIEESQNSDFAYNFLDEKEIEQETINAPEEIEPKKNNIQFEIQTPNLIIEYETNDSEIKTNNNEIPEFLEDLDENIHENNPKNSDESIEDNPFFNDMGENDSSETSYFDMVEEEDVSDIFGQTKPSIVEEETIEKEDNKLDEIFHDVENIIPEEEPETNSDSFFDKIEVEEDGDFIFSDEKDEIQEEKMDKDLFMKQNMRQKPNIMVDKAFSEASNVVITCDAAIMNRLKEQYKALFNKEPHNYFIELINELKTKTSIPYEQDIKKVRTLREKYLLDYEPLNSEDIIFCLNTSKKFTEEF